MAAENVQDILNNNAFFCQPLDILSGLRSNTASIGNIRIYENLYQKHAVNEMGHENQCQLFEAIYWMIAWLSQISPPDSGDLGRVSVLMFLDLSRNRGPVDPSSCSMHRNEHHQP